MRMCVVFLPDCPCCEPLTVKGWITTILFFFFTQPVNEYGATYPLNLFFSSLAIFFPLPHFIRGGLYSSFPPFFSATSCVACFSAPLFYISSGDFMCSLIFSQFSLSSSILSVPPMPLLLRAEVWHNFSKSSWPLPPLRARPPPLPFHLSCFSVHHPPSFFFFFFVITWSRFVFFRRCSLQMILASTLPVWIMHRDYIKTSRSNWSIFNLTRLLVKPASLWSFLCVRICSVCVCLSNWTWVRRRRLKRKTAQVWLSLLFFPSLSVGSDSDRLYWHGI